MTKQEAERQANMFWALAEYGISRDDAESLRRISMTLRHWFELECGTDSGAIERDEATGKPYLVTEWGTRWTQGKRCRTPIADRETGARRRLAAIMARYPTLRAYVQGDPRGCALYIMRPQDVPEGQDADCCYTRGIAVY